MVHGLSLDRVRRAALGDRAAISEVCASLGAIGRPIAARLLRRGGTRADVDDLVNDVLVSFLEEQFRGLLTFDGDKGASLHGYAAVLIQRRIIDRLALKRYRVEGDDGHDAGGEGAWGEGARESPALDPERAAHVGERIAAVVEGLKKRSGYYHDLFCWFHVDRLTNDDVVKITGRSPARISDDKIKMHRVVLAILDGLEDDGVSSGEGA